MTRAWMAVMIAFLVPLAGCAKKESNDQDANHTTGPASGANVTVALAITSAPTPVNKTDPFTLRWSTNLTGANGTKLNVTALYWGNNTVSNPTVASYPNKAGERKNVTPGTFDATLTVNWTATIKLRSFAQVGNKTFWSAEREVTIRNMPVGVAHLVHMTAGGGAVSEFEDDPITIKRGDTVKWSNDDFVAHTATSNPGAPFAFDTDEVPDGEESDAIQFTKTGTIAYKCTFHTRMTGTITVTA